MKTLRIIFLLLLPVLANAQESAYADYIKTYGPLAIAEQQRTGVPASIKLAQGLLESGAGNGELCVRSNNHFGIKCKNTWTGATVFHNDDAKGECFRAYNSAEESYKDHSDFLRANARYASLFQLDVTDYKAWAEGLKKAGYATNPKYVAMLIKVVEENDLNSFTAIALQTPIPSPAIASETQSEIIVPIAKIETPKTEPAIKKRVTPVDSEKYPSGYFIINESKVCYAKAGTSVLALASENNISLTEILTFNDMSRIDILEKDQLIFVERKKKRGATAIYEVLVKASLWNISQQQGIRLNQIAYWNNISMQADIEKGTKLYMQEAAPTKGAAARK